LIDGRSWRIYAVAKGVKAPVAEDVVDSGDEDEVV
jgi:hypothetical protein